MSVILKVTDSRAAEPTQATRGSALRSVLQGRNFRLLWIGQGTSLLGDQFYLVALPWLVLRLTGDPRGWGPVLALAGLPRALLMWVGGAITDRFSPPAIMLISDFARLFLTALLTVLVLTGQVQLWLLYILAIAFGTVSGFFLP